MPKIIFGVNPIIEALKSEHPPEKIFIVHGVKGPGLRDIITLATTKRVLFEQVGRLRFAQLGGDRSAQGVAALISDFEYCTLEDILQVAKERNEPPLIALLDNIEDPRNFGAIIRSAECTGVHGIVIPKHRAVGMTDTVATTSAGAISHIAVSRVTNLINAMEELKAAGVWIAGADQEGEKLVHEADLKGPIGIVLGSEGKGMRRLVKQKCDFLIRIPLKGKINSLNVSVAAGIIFYETLRQRGNHHPKEVTESVAADFTQSEAQEIPESTTETETDTTETDTTETDTTETQTEEAPESAPEALPETKPEVVHESKSEAKPDSKSKKSSD